MSYLKPTKTVTFKTHGQLQIQFDVYLPDGTNNAPVFLWYQGGGLLQGRKETLASYMRRAVNKYQIAVISSDYRLCPQASVAEVLSDVLEGIAFIRHSLAGELPSGAIDSSRLAVSGSSAGGYLSLLAGLYADPKPNVIVPIYPIADPFGTFFTNSQPPPMQRRLASREEMAPFLDPKAPQQANCGPPEEDPRMNMYVRMMHDANLAELYHLDLKARPEDARRFRVAPSVYEHRLPPSYIIHGDADSCVGVEQTDEVVGAMLGCGLEVVYERPHGKDHFLDTGADYENEKMFQFVLGHF